MTFQYWYEVRINVNFQIQPPTNTQRTYSTVFLFCLIKCLTSFDRGTSVSKGRPVTLPDTKSAIERLPGAERINGLFDTDEITGKPARGGAIVTHTHYAVTETNTANHWWFASLPNLIPQLHRFFRASGGVGDRGGGAQPNALSAWNYGACGWFIRTGRAAELLCGRGVAALTAGCCCHRGVRTHVNETQHAAGCTVPTLIR